MTSVAFPSEQEIRDALVRRAETFTRLTGISRSEIGKRAINDGAFISQVGEGRNFTVGSYQRVMNWLDAHWPKQEPRGKRMQSGDTRQKPASERAIGAPGPHRHGESSARVHTGHFSRFRHLQRNYFRTATEIEEHIEKLRKEWSHR